ncbi:MAG: hypothetical protein K1X89_25745 [Myxococcaceae bacterium]|nr:hypothetical protein [Myxococcaceae bacterium]
MTRAMAMVVAVAGGLSLGAGLLAPNWPSVFIGVAVVIVALVARRADVEQGALLGIAIVGVLVSGSLLLGWRTYDRLAPRRDLALDAKYAREGTMVMAQLKHTDEVQVFSNTGDHLDHCAWFNFYTPDERRASANRCDFSPQEIERLGTLKGQWLKLLYLPARLEPRDPSVGIDFFLNDYRLVLELSLEDQKAFEERHVMPPDAGPLEVMGF